MGAKNSSSESAAQEAPQQPLPRAAPPGAAAAQVRYLKKKNDQIKSELEKEIQVARDGLALHDVLLKIKTATFNYGSESSDYDADDRWKEEKTKEINKKIEQLTIAAPPVQVPGESGGGRKNLLPKRIKSSKKRQDRNRTIKSSKKSKRSKKSKGSKRSKRSKKPKK